MLFHIFCKPVRVYRAVIIIVSAVIFYAIVYEEELFTVPTKNNHEKLYIGNYNYEIINNEAKSYNKKHESSSEMHRTKYILFWTPEVTPLDKIKGSGHEPFILSGCKYINCFITRDRRYFSDETNFDAIVFSIPALSRLKRLPKNRSSRQKFVAASIEPPDKYPVINPIYDGFFNWTWTYRLDSDILMRHFRIYDPEGNEVGPRRDINWSKDFASKHYTIDEIDIALITKNTAVIWIKTCCKCKSSSYIEQLRYVTELEQELRIYGLSLATYSNCTGYKSCGNITECNELILKNYYFIMAFEDSFDEDYVTDTLLLAVQNLAIPIVIGKTNYSRFLPPSSYLDAKLISTRVLAAIIDDTIKGDLSNLRKYFRQIHNYNYKSSVKSEICNICSALNNREMVKNYTVYNNFRKTWNGEKSVLVYDFLFKVFERDETLKRMARNSNYIEISNMFRKKHLPEPKDSVFVFNMDSLNLTSTEQTNIIPYELTTDVANN